MNNWINYHQREDKQYEVGHIASYFSVVSDVTTFKAPNILHHAQKRKKTPKILVTCVEVCQRKVLPHEVLETCRVLGVLAWSIWKVCHFINVELWTGLHLSAALFLITFSEEKTHLVRKPNNWFPCNLRQHMLVAHVFVEAALGTVSLLR